MGHTRLGCLTKTRAWVEVVGLIAAGAEIAQIAQATINAADVAFSFVGDDPGYNHAVWLLTQLGLAAKAENPIEHLQQQGIKISENTSLPGIAAALSGTIDNAAYQSTRHSDLGELAHRALIHAVMTRLEPKLRQQSLFNMKADDTQKALASLGKEKEFSQLAREFYSRLTRECMDYFLSRTMSSQLGAGQRFATTNQMAQFEEALSTHCHETSKIVEQYSGEWFSKHRYEEKGAISRESVQGFASWALKKITDELKMGSSSNGH